MIRDKELRSKLRRDSLADAASAAVAIWCIGWGMYGIYYVIDFLLVH